MEEGRERIGTFLMCVTERIDTLVVDVLRKVQRRLDKVNPGYVVKFLYVWDAGELEDDE